MIEPLIPEGESLRRAFQWLADQGGHCTLKMVEQASFQIDLNPRDEQILLRQYVHHRGATSDTSESRQ